MLSNPNHSGAHHSRCRCVAHTSCLGKHVQAAFIAARAESSHSSASGAQASEHAAPNSMEGETNKPGCESAELNAGSLVQGHSDCEGVGTGGSGRLTTPWLCDADGWDAIDGNQSILRRERALPDLRATVRHSAPRARIRGQQRGNLCHGQRACLWQHEPVPVSRSERTNPFRGGGAWHRGLAVGGTRAFAI